MKKNLFHLMTTLALGVMMSFAACSEDSTTQEKPGPNPPDDGTEEVAPNFPAAETKTLDAGESLVMEFTPNYDWTVSIPSEQMVWFWIQDGEHKVSTLRGKADEAVTLEIRTSEQEEFDEAPVCEVKMTMNGEERVIATITRGTVEREFAIYPCAIVDDTFEPSAGDLKYSYQTTAVTEIELLWPEGLNGYSHPMLFEANFDWHVVPATMPEWLTLSVAEGKAGEQVEVLLSGSNELEAREAEILFCDADNTEVTYALTVRMADCLGRFAVEGFDKESLFNAAGEYRMVMSNDLTSWLPAEVGASGYVTDVKDTKVYVFAMENDKPVFEAEAAAWINASLSAWNDSEGNLQTRELTLKVAVNEGAEREGLLYVMPAAEAPASVQDVVGGAYDKYLVTHIRQSEAPAPAGAVTPLYPEDMEGHATFVEMSEENNNNFELVYGMGPYGNALFFEKGYVLHYMSAYAADYSAMKASQKFTARFYNADYQEMSGEESWLSIMTLEDGDFRILMNPGLDTVDISDWGMEIDHLGYVGLFDEQGNPWTLIRCEYTEEEVVIDGFNIAFSYPSQVSGASITKITNENLASMVALYPDMEDTFTENLATNLPMFVLEYTTESPTMALLTISEYYMCYASNWVVIDEEGGNSAIRIDMSGRDVKGAMDRIEFYDKQFSSICFLYCVANF